MGKFTVDIEIPTAEHATIKEICEIVEGHSNFKQFIQALATEYVLQVIKRSKPFITHITALERENLDSNKQISRYKEIFDKIANLSNIL